jgi:hypothetical protein
VAVFVHFIPQKSSLPSPTFNHTRGEVQKPKFKAQGKIKTQSLNLTGAKLITLGTLALELRLSFEL